MARINSYFVRGGGGGGGGGGLVYPKHYNQFFSLNRIQKNNPKFFFLMENIKNKAL